MGIAISPEALRMFFYIGFFVFATIAIFVTVTWSDIDYDDNIIKQTYGVNQICIFFDYAPFSHFGATLWLPNVFFITAYLVLDLFRIYDAKNDGQLSVAFYRGYFAVTVFEIFAFC